MRFGGVSVLLCALLAACVAADVNVEVTAAEDVKTKIDEPAVVKPEITVSEAEAANVEEQVKNEHGEDVLPASKDIPIEHDSTEDDEESEAGDKPVVAADEKEVIIAPEDMEKMRDPEMKRLARQLSAFHGRQVFHLNAALHNNMAAGRAAKRQLVEDDDDDAVAEERAVRRRKRVRRRNSKNRVNRVHNNRHTANRRNTRRRNSKNRNSVRLSDKYKYQAKRSKQKNKQKLSRPPYKTGNKNSGVRRGNNRAKPNKRRGANNGKRTTKRRGSSATRKSRKSKNGGGKNKRKKAPSGGSDNSNDNANKQQQENANGSGVEQPAAAA